MELETSDYYLDRSRFYNIELKCYVLIAFLRCLKHPGYHAALYADMQAPLHHS